MESYKGYTWETQKELGQKLGKASSTVSGWLKKNKNKTLYDYIDFVLSSPDNEGEYKDLKWDSFVDLSKQLGKSRSYVRTWLNRNPDKTVYDCIEEARVDKPVPPSKKWMEHYGILKEYYDEYKSLNISVATQYKGFSIGKWLSHQREYFRSGKMSEEKKKLLEEICINWHESKNKKHENQSELRVGEEFVSSQGQKYKITEYKDSHTVTVEFEDGTVLKNRSYKNARNGSIKNPNYMNSKIGEIYQMKNGQMAKIISYDGRGKVSVEFSDGTIRKEVEYESVKNGKVGNPNYTRADRNREKYLGKEFLLNNGFKVKIIGYENCHNVTIQFKDGKTKKCRYECLRKGEVAHPDNDAVFNRKGKTFIAGNGLEIKILEYRGCRNVDVEFEDGEIIKDARYENVVSGNLKHPYLSRKGKSKYMDFAIDGLAFEEDKNVYYHCQCTICKMEDILTPQQMIEHKKSHKGE